MDFTLVALISVKFHKNQDHPRTDKADKVINEECVLWLTLYEMIKLSKSFIPDSENSKKSSGVRPSDPW